MRRRKKKWTPLRRKGRRRRQEGGRGQSLGLQLLYWMSLSPGQECIVVMVTIIVAMETLLTMETVAMEIMVHVCVTMATNGSCVLTYLTQAPSADEQKVCG